MSRLPKQEVERPPDYTRQLRKWQNDTPSFISSQLKIVPKVGGIVPLYWNPVQNLIWSKIEETLKAGKNPWFLILKCRQAGISTQCAAIVYSLVALFEGRNGILIGYDDDSTKKLFQMSHLFYSRSSPSYRPDIRHSNKMELKFDNAEGTGLNSHILIDNSNNTEAGRSMTLHAAHLTELARWRNPSESMISVKNALVDNGWLFIEYTAKGMSNYGYELWQETVNGDNDMTPIFIPWWMVPEYKTPTTKDNDFITNLSDEEKDLQKKYSLRPEQMAWRRWCIRNKCENDEDTFRQEYPSSPEEAFTSSVSSIYNRTFIKKSREKARDGVRGWMRKDGTFKESPEGPLTIYHPPEHGNQYFTAWDVSLGGDRSDPECGQVIDKHLRQVAEWHGHLDPVALAEPIIGVGRHYKQALTAIETNKMGIITQHEVKKEYYNLYRHTYLDRFADQQTQNLGWFTSVSTKPALVAWAVHLCNEMIPEVNSRKLLSEMESFMQVGPASWQCAPPHKDDRVMAWMIAAFVAKVALKGYISPRVAQVEPDPKPGEHRFSAIDPKDGVRKEIFMPSTGKGPLVPEDKGPFPWMAD